MLFLDSRFHGNDGKTVDSRPPSYLVLFQNLTLCAEMTKWLCLFGLFIVREWRLTPLCHTCENGYSKETIKMFLIHNRFMGEFPPPLMYALMSLNTDCWNEETKSSVAMERK
jgi:hypothetical protein